MLRRRLSRAVIVGALTGVVLALWGCPEGSERTREAGEASGSLAQESLRLVSLSPAISQVLVDLDLSEHVVGRTGYCTSLDPAIPVIGDLLDLDFENLVRVEPTHLLIQPPASGVDSRVEELARENGWKVFVRRLNTLEDIATMARDIPAFLGPAMGDDLRARTVATGEALARDVLALREPDTPARWRGRVLMALPGDPPLVFGQGTYLHDLLVAMGSTNAAEQRGWAQLTLEDVAQLDPDAILVISADEEVAASGSNAAGRLADLDIRATREGRVAVVAHRDIMHPSTRVVAVARALRVALDGFAKDAP